MKETGVIRRLDELGRVVIPKEIRKRLKIKNGDMVDIYTNNEHIILQKYHPLNQDILPIRAMLEAIKEEYNLDLLLFDDTKILYSTLRDMKADATVNAEFVKKIEVYLDKELSSKLGLDIIEGYPLKKDILIRRILVEYESYGYIAVMDDMIGKQAREALGIIRHYFNHILEN